MKGDESDQQTEKSNNPGTQIDVDVIDYNLKRIQIMDVQGLNQVIPHNLVNNQQNNPVNRALPPQGDELNASVIFLSAFLAGINTRFVKDFMQPKTSGLPFIISRMFLFTGLCATLKLLNDNIYNINWNQLDNASRVKYAGVVVAGLLAGHFANEILSSYTDNSSA